MPVAVNASGADEEIRSSTRVAFRGISCTLKSTRGDKVILDSIDGCCVPGTITAVLGPSGAGKSTLLDILAGRKNYGRLQGEVFYNGMPSTKEVVKTSVALVEQYETLLESLTVQEMCMYTAALRLSHQTQQNQQAVVDDLLAKLQLSECRNVLIGNRLKRGISGGQAKRTNIAIALIDKPGVLLLDEPTSGLDAYTAEEVMILVHGMALQGSATICATLHQPSSRVMSLCARVLLLVQGCMAYAGPAGDPMVAYFTTCGAPMPPLLPHDNLAEWMTRILGEADRRGNGEGGGASLSKLFRQSAAYQHEISLIASMETANVELQKAEIRRQMPTRRASSVQQLCILWRFRTTSQWRSPAWLASRCLHHACAAFVLASVYWQKGRNPQTADDAAIVSAIAFLFALMPSFAAQIYIPGIMGEQPVFLREQAEGLYHASAYLVHRMIGELAVVAVLSPIISVVVHYTTGIGGSVGFMTLVFFVTVSISTIFGYLVTAALPSFELASSMVAAYIGSLMYFTGFFIAWAEIPPWWKWYAIINYLRYCSGALLLDVFEPGGGAPGVGAQVLASYSLTGASKWAYVGYASIVFAVFWVLTWVCLRFVKYTQR